MKNIKFMALISPLILCGCSSTPEPTPTVTTYAVALQSGEGTFSDGKTCIVLNNVIGGTALNQIEGYKLPEEEDCIFSNWLDEQGNVVSPTITITSNLVLTATYETDPEVIRKELGQKIEGEGQRATDYAIDKQVSFDYLSQIADVITTALEKINDSKNVTSSAQMKMIYEFTHLCIETMNKIDAVLRYGYSVYPYDTYKYIGNTYCESIKKYANKKLTVDQLTVIHNLSKTLLLSYWQDNGAMYLDEIYEQYTAKATNTTSALELREIDKIGCGLIRGCSRQNEEVGYTLAEGMVNEKLTEAKKIFTQDDGLTTIIDCLGNAASIYCKYGGEGPSAFEPMYAEVLRLLKNEEQDPHASNKLKILLAFIEADGYYIDNDAISSEGNLLKYLNSKIDADGDGKHVEGIVKIAEHGANALKQYNEHCENYKSFMETIKTAVDTYIEADDFLDCAIYAMDIGTQLNLVSEDLFFKEYIPSISTGASGYSYSLYINYAKINEPFRQAIVLFKNAIAGDFPEKKLEALKIVIKGIIATSKLTVLTNGKNDPTTDFVTAFTDGNGLERMAQSSISAATGFAYACTGLNYVFSYLSMMTTPDTYAQFKVEMQPAKIIEIFDNWMKVMVLASYNDYLARFIGQAIRLSWQEDCTRIAQTLDAMGDRAGAVNSIFVHADAWLNRITDCLRYIDSQETIYSIEDVIISTLSSDRFYYYGLCGAENTPGSEFWGKCQSTSEDKEEEYLPALLPLIYNSTTIEQFVARANIYVTEFIEEINKQNHDASFKNLENEIFAIAKQDMEAVK